MKRLFISLAVLSLAVLSLFTSPALASSAFADAVAGESQLVPADKPFAEQAAFTRTSEFASLKAYTSKTVIISKKLKKKPKKTYSLAIKLEINKRYDAAIEAVESRKTSAETSIETAATAREAALTAAADTDYNTDYEALTLNLEVEKQKLLVKKEKLIKKLTKRYTRVVNWPKRNGKIKVISFVPAPKQRVLRRKIKAVESRIRASLQSLDDKIESEKSLLTERYTEQLTQIDTIVSTEKAASYEALNSSIEAETELIQAEKVQLDKNLNKISKGTIRKSGPNKHVPKAKPKKKHISKKSLKKKINKITHKAKKKTVKKARKIVHSHHRR